MNELENYNEEIYLKEKDVFERENVANESKKALDIAKLVFKSELDPKDKAFSNEEKREFTASQHEPIMKQIADLKTFEYETELRKIEVRYMLRKLNILIKCELI